MLYYRPNAAAQPVGPVEPAALHAAIHDGTLSPETLAVEADGTEWRPLAQLLKYYYSIAGEVLGPVRLAELTALAAAHGGDFPVMPKGGTEWLPVAIVLRLPPAKFVRAPVTIARSSREAGGTTAKGLYMPDAAKAAGVIWFVFGLVKLIDCLAMVGSLSAIPVHARDSVILVWALSLAASVIFLRAGLQTCSGSAGGTRGNGAGSIGLGGLAWFSAVNGWESDDSFIRAVLIFSAASLLIAGFLALVSDKSYRAWREAHRR